MLQFPDEAIVAGNALCGKVIAVVNQELEPRDVTLFFCGSEQAVVEHRKKTLYVNSWFDY
jgi:hypothetical protein